MTIEQDIEHRVRRLGYEMEMLHWGQYVAGNAAAWDRLDPDRLRDLPHYRRVAEVVALLRTSRVEGIPFTRIGREFDGGYVMLDSIGPPAVSAGYSLGIADDVSWDLDVASRGVSLTMYDPTIGALPSLVPGGTFRKQGVRGAAEIAGSRTLAEIVADNGHQGRDDLVLKMDVEGMEWDVLAEVSAATLAQFSQIVIEFHRMGKVLHPPGHAEVKAAFSKLALTHVPVHVHGNNVRLPVRIGDLILPDVIEVSWVRRSDHEGRLIPRNEPFPTDLDRPNIAHRVDLFLGWTYSGGERH